MSHVKLTVTELTFEKDWLKNIIYPFKFNVPVVKVLNAILEKETYYKLSGVKHLFHTISNFCV